MKKALSVILCAVLVIACIPFVSAQETVKKHEWDDRVKTTCNGECGVSPVIVVPGIMQSQTYLQDKQGNDIMTEDGFPITEGMDLAFMFDTVVLKRDLKNAIGDILKAILKRDRNELFDILINILDKNVAAHYFNPDGTRVNSSQTDEYWYSLEEAKTAPDKSYLYAKGYKTDDDGNTLPIDKYKNQYDFIYRQVDISGYCDKYGYDHAYYYAYPSFCDMFEAAEGLSEFIDMVKAQTGHDKVSIVFISLGGVLGNIFMSEYVDPEEIDRVVFAAAAMDGSCLLGDLMAADSTLDNAQCIYNDLIPNIVELAADEYMALAYAGNTIARIIPENLFNDFLSEALTRGVNECLNKIIANCQSMWGLVPSGMYPELSQKLISDEAHAPLKVKTDKYYNIQLNAASRLQQLTNEGMEIFVICGYNLEFPALIKQYKTSSDNIIQVGSTSLGAVCAPIGEKLPADYVPAIDKSYINPDKTLDAGSCALPDRTFFIKNQSHLKLQDSVNDVIELCVQLMVNKDIKDARINNGGYPQFNEYRDLSEVERMLYKYYSADLSSLDENKKKAVDDAAEKGFALLESKVWSQDETDEVEKELYTALHSAKLYGDDSPTIKYRILPFIERIFKNLSDIFTKIFGGNDYWLFNIKFI